MREQTVVSKKSNLMIIFLSLLLGFLLYISPAFVFCIFLTVLLFFMTLNNTDIEDRHFMSVIMGLNFIVKLIGFVLVEYYCFKIGYFDIFGDAHMNIEVGLQISDFLTKGQQIFYIPFSYMFKSGRYNIHGMTFFNGLYFSIFGNDIISIKYINILCSLITGWMVYDLTKRISSSAAGKIAISIVLFWPTIFVWSLTDLKESHFFLALIAAFWFFNKIAKSSSVKRRIVFFIPLTTSVIYLITLRPALMLPIVLVCAVISGSYYLFIWCRNKNNKMTIKLTPVIFMSGILLFIGYSPHIFQNLKGYYELALGYNAGFLATGGWNYNLLEGNPHDFYTVSFFLKYIVGSWLHFLLEPLPWHIFSLSMIMLYPAMFIWYLILFFSVTGAIRICRAGKGREVFPILIFLVLYITVVGVSVSNIGTAVRFRDAVTPIIIILASCNLTKARKEILCQNTN